MGFQVLWRKTREKVAEPNTRCPPPPKYTAEARRVGDEEAGFGGKGTSDLHVGAGGRELSPVPVGRQAGTGSHEQCLLSGACQPRGCARSGGGVGTPCALLSGKQCCREMGAEVVGGSMLFWCPGTTCSTSNTIWKQSYSVAESWATSAPL